MTSAQTYLEEELKKCSQYTLTQEDQKILDKDGVQTFIFKKITSKKFRKYSANEELLKHISQAIKINIANNQPINITFLHGAYKLWRLEEAPEADWAELFAAMYYTNWLKPICEVYKPGVWFDYFVDDIIVEKLNNIPLKDIDSYLKSYQNTLDFLKKYQPNNMKMTITTVSSKFDSIEAFEASLANNIKTLSQTNHVYTEKQLEMVSLNAKPSAEQEKDPHWKEKIHLIHDAYLMTKREPGYHFQDYKILAFNQTLPSGSVIAVGTTKTSIAKFWVGIGALKTDGQRYTQYILTPTQIAAHTFTLQKVQFFQLPGKNFKTIRIFS